jgi:ABC-type transport system involved in multi-copper enzyme maturation permease subunit
MLRPILYQEMLLGSRRSQPYLFRWLFAGWLVLQLSGYLLLAGLIGRTAGPAAHWDHARFAADARAYAELYVTQLLVLLILATPALAAGAISDEKTSGTLQYLLTADLSASEIVVGKLLGRCYQVLLLALTGLPLLCFFGGMGGVDPGTLLILGVAVAALVFALAGASLLASVLCRHTRDAVLCFYATVLLGSLVLAVLRGALESLAAGSAPVTLVTGFLDALNPFAVFSSGWTLETGFGLARRAAASVLTWSVLGLGGVLLASVRMRAAYLRQLEGQGKKKRHWWRARRPDVSDRPLHWKERHVEGIAPLAMLRRLPRWLGLLLVATATILSSGAILLNHLPLVETPQTVLQRLLEGDLAGLLEVAANLRSPAGAFFRQGVTVMLLAGVVIGIRCSGAVTGERERQTWEALLLTPLETRELLRGKLWGIVGASCPYLLAYAIPALLLSAIGGVESFLWTLLWLAVTGLALFYVGAAGLWCSVRARSSWRSLLATLGLTYLGGFALYCVTSMLAGVVALVLLLVLLVWERLAYTGSSAATRTFGTIFDYYSVAFCIALAILFVLMAWGFIRSAEYRVSILERTKHWKREPRRLRRAYRAD